MKNEKSLLEGFKKGALTMEELSKLEDLIRQGRLEVSDFEDISGIDDFINKHIRLSPPKSMDQNFYSMLKDQQKGQIITSLRSSQAFVISVAATILLVLGFFIGRMSHSVGKYDPMSEKTSIANSTNLLLPPYQAATASARLDAVIHADQMQAPYSQIIEALLFSVNFDSNSNVRMAAIEALMPYADQREVREGLVQSIQNQDSPLVIMTLAEVLYEMGEKQALYKIKERLSPDIPDKIATQINNNIQSLF